MATQLNNSTTQHLNNSTTPPMTRHLYCIEVCTSSTADPSIVDRATNQELQSSLAQLQKSLVNRLGLERTGAQASVLGTLSEPSPMWGPYSDQEIAEWHAAEVIQWYWRRSLYAKVKFVALPLDDWEAATVIQRKWRLSHHGPCENPACSKPAMGGPCDWPDAYAHLSRLCPSCFLLSPPIHDMCPAESEDDDIAPWDTCSCRGRRHGVHNVPCDPLHECDLPEGSRSA